MMTTAVAFASFNYASEIRKAPTLYAWEEKEQFPSGLRITKPIRFVKSTERSVHASNGTASMAIPEYSIRHERA